jgi:hypothetical protein
MKKRMYLKRLLLISTIYSLLSLLTVSAEANKKVLQVDASLSFAQQLEFEKVPFILLEGEPSTLSEEGLGGYKVELLAYANQDKTFTLSSKIYKYTKSGYTLLGTPSIKLKYQVLGLIEFESASVGHIELQVEIVKLAEMATDNDGFGEAVR